MTAWRPRELYLLVTLLCGAFYLGGTWLGAGRIDTRRHALRTHPLRAESRLGSGTRALVLLPTQNLPVGLSVTPIFNTNLAGRILFRVCNATGKAVDPPLGAWAYVVWR